MKFPNTLPALAIVAVAVITLVCVFVAEPDTPAAAGVGAAPPVLPQLVHAPKLAAATGGTHAQQAHPLLAAAAAPLPEPPPTMPSSRGPAIEIDAAPRQPAAPGADASDPIPEPDPHAN